MTPWWESDPDRLDRDRRELAEKFPELVLDLESEPAGRWHGCLPDWPFDRPPPERLDALTEGSGLLLDLRYRQSYPMVPPRVFPLAPSPEVNLRMRHDWHLQGDGSLCLLRSEALWTGRESIVDLLLKAAGWRVEYALMTARAIKSMSENGIVDDPVHDHLVEAVACLLPSSS